MLSTCNSSAKVSSIRYDSDDISAVTTPPTKKADVASSVTSQYPSVQSQPLDMEPIQVGHIRIVVPQASKIFFCLPTSSYERFMGKLECYLEFTDSQILWYSTTGRDPWTAFYEKTYPKAIAGALATDNTCFVKHSIESDFQSEAKDDEETDVVFSASVWAFIS
jgi:hypothetical protein